MPLQHDQQKNKIFYCIFLWWLTSSRAFLLKINPKALYSVSFSCIQKIIWCFFILLLHNHYVFAQKNPAQVPTLSYENAIVQKEQKENITFYLEDSRELIWGYDHSNKKLFYFDGFDYTYFEPEQDGDLGCLEDAAPFQIMEDVTHKLWLLYPCGLFLYDPTTNKLKNLNDALQLASKRPVLTLYNMILEKSGKIYLSTQTGLFEYTPSKKLFTFFDLGKYTSRGSALIYLVFESNDGNIYFSDANEIVKFDLKKNRVIQKKPFLLNLAYPPYGSYVVLPSSIIIRSNGIINGIQVNNNRDFTYTKFNLQEDRFSILSDEYPEFPPFIWVRQRGNVILSIDSLGNLYEYREKEDQFIRLLNVYDFIPNDAKAREIDVFKPVNRNVLWLITPSSTFKITTSELNFSLQQYPKSDYSKASIIISRDGIIKYQNNVYFKSLPKLMPIRNKKVEPIDITLPLDWTGVGIAEFIESPNNGLFGIWAYMKPNKVNGGRPNNYSFYFWTRNRQGKENFKIYPFPPQSPQGYRGGIFIGKMTADRQSNIWIGGWEGVLNKINFHHKSITHIDTRPKNVKSNGLVILMADQQNNIWVAYNSKGIDLYNDKKLRSYVYNNQARQSLSSNFITAVHEDKQQLKWIGTFKGLNVIDSKNNKIDQYFTKDGLLDNKICGIVNDKKGQLWAFTPRAISLFSPLKKRFYSFLISQQSFFMERARPLVDDDGYIFMESSKGIFFFHPDSFKINVKTPKPYLKRISINNDSYQYHTLDHQNNQSKKDRIIHLKHFQNSLTLHFGAAEFYSPSEVRFAYFLERYDQNWQSVGQVHQATYTRLPPGTYQFKLKAANNHDIWSEELSNLQIIIHAPWYWAWWSKTLYFLILSGAVYAFYHYQLKRQLEQAETLRLREMDQFKTRLYTNITHEFRTPLAVILGMANKIEQAPNRWLQEGVQMIRRNGRNLLRLVNQLLDLAKLEAGSLSVHYVKGDIIVYLRYIAESFHSLAESKDINLKFQTDQDELIMDYDPDKLLQIVSNLLSNAIKFTTEGGKITMEVDFFDENALLIQVKDTGVGIPPEKLPLIFDRFYQVDDSATRLGEGSGIGLALSKELVDLLGGRISVQSQVNQGSIFEVALPVKRQAELQAVPSNPGFNHDFTPFPHKVDDQIVGEASTPLVLVVEDNADVIKYLSSYLEGTFRLAVAQDGQEGIDQAIELVPDLIISDVMMPYKDGFTLCKELKNDFRTSHIPIVLLTAKADIESRISGLRRGADAYLAKPFEEEELLVILENLLAIRKTLQAKYSSIDFLSGVAPAESSLPEANQEDEFIRQLRKIVLKHLDDAELDVTKLCHLLTTSRTQLHNKLKALTGMSTTEFIRSIRIIKAKELLLASSLNISQVAYACGFQSPPYFSKVFSELEGCSASEFREKYKNQQAGL